MKDMERDIHEHLLDLDAKNHRLARDRFHSEHVISESDRLIEEALSLALPGPIVWVTQ